MIQIITGFLGSLSFSLLFNIRRKLIIPASLGGLFGWIVYALISGAGYGVFSSSMAASAFAAIYSEILARVFRTPATVFYIPAVIPIVPGSLLYYTMNSMAFGDRESFGIYGAETFFCVLGIACGIFFVSGVVKIGNKKNLSD